MNLIVVCIILQFEHIKNLHFLQVRWNGLFITWIQMSTSGVNQYVQNLEFWNFDCSYLCCSWQNRDYPVINNGGNKSDPGKTTDSPQVFDIKRCLKRELTPGPFARVRRIMCNAIRISALKAPSLTGSEN